ncbi:MAG: biopolymer transporter ExbD [Pseudomonadota bacterium]
MRRRGTHQEEAADVNVTPLLDIVFIMLIFFIVTATFLREKGIDIRTPESNEDDQDSIPPPALLLAIQEDGFVRVNNVRLIDPKSVKPVVEEFVAREPEGVVLVSANPEADAGVAVTVVDEAYAGNAGAVSLALQQEVQ